MPRMPAYLACLCLAGTLPAPGQISSRRPTGADAPGSEARFAEEQSSLRTSLASDPDNVEMHTRLAASYILEAAKARGWASPAQQTELQLRAEPELRAVIGLHPQDVPAIMRLGRLYESLAHSAADESQRELRYTQAENLYRNAMALPGGAIPAKIASSRLMMNRVSEDCERSGVRPSELAQGDIPSPATRVALAAKYAAPLETALADATQALQFSPSNTTVLMTLSMLHLERGALAASSSIAETDRAAAADLQNRAKVERDKLAALHSSGVGSGTATSGGAYRMGGGVSQPKLIFKVDPAYSDQARDAKLQGTVVLRVVVEPSGEPSQVDVVRGLGLGLDESAIQCVRQWRFAPGEKEGHPVAVMAMVEINFRLLPTAKH